MWNAKKMYDDDCSTSRLPVESFVEVIENANGPDQDLASAMALQILYFERYLQSRE